MSSPLASGKRKLEDNAVETPVAKRGRGRPRKNPDAPPPPPKDPNAPTRGRGRPRKNPDATPPPPKDPNAPTRGRGRPRKNPDATPPPPKDPDAPTRGRGRPRKNPDAPAPAKPVNNVTGRGRGRPPKNQSASNEQKKEKLNGSKAGRPRKDASTLKDAASSKSPKKKESTTSKDVTLETVIGTYEIDCEAVVNDYDLTDSMAISITTLPHTDSALIAGFNLGIIEGVMLLAADRDTLEAMREQMEKETIALGKKSKSESPVLQGRTLYFAWRGENISDSKIHHGKFGSQTGILKFKDDKCLMFEGEGAFPALGSHCVFQGERTSDRAIEKPKSWNSFSEEAAEEANRERWG